MRLLGGGSDREQAIVCKSLLEIQSEFKDYVEDGGVVIATASLGKLYTFCVDPDVLLELEQIIHLYTARNTDRKFKSLQILEVMK